MKRRLRVLLSAYSCEPGKGSEPEVGWQWARQVARWHDVTVLTRANNEPSIRAGLAAEGSPVNLTFRYHDLPAPWPRLKKATGFHGLYYRLWQASARKVIARMVREQPFDLLHHVTYAGARFPIAILGHGVRSLWGPVGGFESIPAPLLPWEYPGELAEELVRNAANFVSEKMGTLGRKGGAATLAIASTEETAAALARSGVQCKLLPTIGVNIGDFVGREVTSAKELRLLFAGRLLYWKGVELAIRAVHAAGGDTQLTFVGEGKFRPHAERLVSALGLQGKVHFLGQVARATLLSMYREYDAMLFPSLHDTGGGVLLEGMATGVPVICLHCGGPALAVADDCGIRVPLGSRAEVVAGLAAAIRRYAAEPDLRRAHGRQARKRIAEKYDMDRKGEAMNAIYEEAMAR